MIVVNDRCEYCTMKMDNLGRLIKAVQSVDDLVNKQPQMEEFVRALQQKLSVENAKQKEFGFKRKKK